MIKKILKIYPDQYYDQKNNFYKAWQKHENKKKLPLYLNNIIQDDYKNFYNKIINIDSVEAEKLVISLLAGNVYLLKNFYSKKESKVLKDKVYNIFQNTPEEFHKIKDGVPDYHRYISMKLSKKYSIRLVKQSYYVFPWNDEKLNIYKKIYPVWRMLKKISGYHPSSWEKNSPRDGIIDRIQVARYPPRDGQAELHQDPYIFQKFVISIYLSKKGKDYDGGGFYALNHKKEKFFLDDIVDTGDLFFGFATIKHGVDPCNVHNIPDPKKKDGRWWIGLYSVETDYVTNRRTAKSVNK